MITYNFKVGDYVVCIVKKWVTFMVKSKIIKIDGDNITTSRIDNGKHLLYFPSEIRKL